MYTVYFILDENFGEKALKIAENHPVWLPDTAHNRLAASKCKFEARDRAWNDYGVTFYKPGTGYTREELFFEMIRTVDEHHNEYSHQPSWQRLIVIGVSSSESIMADLNSISPGEIIDTPIGFEYIKK